MGDRVWTLSLIYAMGTTRYMTQVGCPARLELHEGVDPHHQMESTCAHTASEDGHRFKPFHERYQRVVEAPLGSFKGDGPEGYIHQHKKIVPKSR